MKGESLFSTENHLQNVKLEISDIIKTWDNINTSKLEGIVKTIDAFGHHLCLRTKQTSSWLTVRYTKVTYTVPLNMEFCIFLCERYNVTPPNLQHKYGCCSQQCFSCHGLSFRHGGIFIACHKEVRDELLYLSQWYLPPNCVCGEPLYTRDEEYQSRRYVRWGAYLRVEETS